jgi:hypothetical protein
MVLLHRETAGSGIAIYCIHRQMVRHQPVVMGYLHDAVLIEQKFGGDTKRTSYEAWEQFETSVFSVRMNE